MKWLGILSTLILILCEIPAFSAFLSKKEFDDIRGTAEEIMKGYPKKEATRIGYATAGKIYRKKK